MIAFSPKFVHNFFINMYQFILRQFAEVCPRKPYRLVVTTYQKAIQMLHQKSLNQDMYALQYPLLILQPNSYTLDEQVNNLWRFGNRMTAYALRPQKGILKFGDFEILYTTLMYRMTFDVFYLGESHFEIIDALNAFYRKFTRYYKYFNNIPGYIYLTDAIKDIIAKYDIPMDALLEHPQFLFRYENKYNQHLYMYLMPYSIFFRITDITDGSNYMGEQELPTYRIQCACECMFNVPNEIYFSYRPKLDIIRLELGVENQIAYSDIYWYNYRPSKFGVTLLQATDFDDPCILSISKNILKNYSLNQLQIYYVEYQTGKEIILDNVEKYIDDRLIHFKIKNVDSRKGFLELVLVHPDFVPKIKEGKAQELLDGFEN